MLLQYGNADEIIKRLGINEKLIGTRVFNASSAEMNNKLDELIALSDISEVEKCKLFSQWLHEVV